MGLTRPASFPFSTVAVSKYMEGFNCKGGPNIETEEVRSNDIKEFVPYVIGDMDMVGRNLNNH